MDPRFPTSPPPSIHASRRPRLRALRPLLLALCSLPFALSAQYFTLGTDPASVKWHQIKTEHFKIIYPESLDQKALYIANAFEHFRNPGSASLDVQTNRWPVILHNQTIISNGMTPYAPKRIEFITTPPQANEDTYGQDWLDQLVIHEYRHAVQYTAVNRGFTRGLSWIFGQQAVAGIFGAFVPFWFIEGDAVVTETATSHSGRGRVPAYEMKLKAQFLEKGRYSYDKAYNGSYRDFTPDWYELGYLLVGQTRVEFGKETFSNVMRRTGNLPFILVPFSNTLYRETGYGKSKLYKYITAKAEERWRAEDQSLFTSQYTTTTNYHDRFYTNRTQPAVLSDGSIIARKESMDDITRIIVIDTSGNECILANPGYMTDKNLSVDGNLVCWAESRTDPRWNLRTYSVIMTHNLKNGETKQITNKTKYFSPHLTRDGKKIVTVEADPGSIYHLVILDSESGEVLEKFGTPQNYFPDHPAWSPDGEKIAVILTRNEGKSLVLLNSKSGEYETLLPFSYVEMTRPCFYNGYILFTASYTGIDNIFAIDTGTGKLFRVTSARFGAKDAEVNPAQNQLYYSNYTANGYEIVKTTLEPRTWIEWDPAVENRFPLADQLAAQEDFIFKAENVPDSAYSIKPYRKGLHLINLHSWAPVAVDIDNADANPGVSLLSQNLLGTSNTTLGYEYNLNEEAGKYFLKYSYTGLYPVFDLDVDYGLRRGRIADSTHGQISYHYDEMNLGGWVRVPLNFNVRSWYAGLQPYLGYNYKLLKMNPGQEVKFTKDRYNSLNTAFVVYAQSRMSERDLNPKWGQRLELNYRQTLFEGDSISSIFETELDLYLPGLFSHHSLVLNLAYQKRLIDEYNYTYGDLISVPRGYSGLNTNNMFSGSAGYEFPVFNPDWNIGPLVYLKRLKAALFCDYAVAFDWEPNQEYISTGVDLTVDFHLFRLFAPMEAGLRTIYFPQTQTWGFEFLYGLNLNY